MGNRPSRVLDWTDEQERAAVRSLFPQWELASDDVIFCMSWYDPGWRDGAAPSAPLTVQVRRHGVDLARATKTADFDEVSMAASEALDFAEVIGVEPWDQLRADLEAEADAAVAAEERRELDATNAEAAAAVYAQAAKEAEEDAAAAAAHAEAHPDDDQLQQVAAYTESQVPVMKEYAERAAATATELA